MEVKTYETTLRKKAFKKSKKTLLYLTWRHPSVEICTIKMECMHPRLIKNPADEKLSMIVPCRVCPACKVNKTSEWTMRLLMQRQTTPNCRFATLTYNQEHLPENGSLVKEDVSKFFKSFRQELDDRKIKMFSCGEYGDSQLDSNGKARERPHYHSIIFGVEPDDRFAVAKCWQKSDSWKFTGSTWQKSFGTVTPDSCQYVSGYCQKKYFGNLATEKYEQTGRIPPFQLQSKLIGEDYFKEHISQIVKDGFILFRGKRHPIPEHWKKKFMISGDKYKNDLIAQKYKDFLDKGYNFFELADFYSEFGLHLWEENEVSEIKTIAKHLADEHKFLTNPLKNKDRERMQEHIKNYVPLSSDYSLDYNLSQIMKELEVVENEQNLCTL